MSSRHSQQNARPVNNWPRKAQGAAFGFAGGFVIGAVGSVLHSRQWRASPQSLQAALFLGTVLAVGGAIKTN